MSVTFTTTAGIATLTLNRPSARNALDDNSIKALAQCCQKIKKDKKIIAVVLQGSGKDFCAGADLNTMKRNGKFSTAKNKNNALVFVKLLHEFKQLNKPLISVVQGSVFGGAIGLIACSDIVIAATNTTFCFSEIKIGLVPAMISPYVIEAIGERATKYYALTAKPFNAQEAKTLGLVHEVTPLKNLHKILTSLIHSLKQHAPNATKKTKELFLELKNKKTTTQIQHYTAQLMATVRASKEAQEGLTAFLEKRPARWGK